MGKYSFTVPRDEGRYLPRPSGGALVRPSNVPELAQLGARKRQFRRARHELSEAADRDIGMPIREFPEALARFPHQCDQEQSSAPMSSAIPVAVGWADRDANWEE